jgi:hypothetical protein
VGCSGSWMEIGLTWARRGGARRESDGLRAIPAWIRPYTLPRCYRRPSPSFVLFFMSILLPCIYYILLFDAELIGKWLRTGIGGNQERGGRADGGLMG